MLGQLGLPVASESPSWGVLLSGHVRSVQLGLGVPEQGAERRAWCVAAGALGQSLAGVNTAAFRSALPVYTSGSELLSLTLALRRCPASCRECWWPVVG